ncbi:MAG: peptide chain release factor 1 [Acidimicrobiales bacterium]|nr:peptide chain release factor 1 [Acidimicrobiales bacterium]
MWDRIESLELELRDVEVRLGDPAVQSDPSQLAVLGRRFKELEEIVAVGVCYRAATEDLEVANEMFAEASGDDREELRDEINTLETAIAVAEEELKVLLLPKDPNADRNVIIEIRGAAGGEEANLFARDLFTMYEAFAKRQGWRLEMLGASLSDLGGFTEVAAILSGDAVWTRMKHEAGTHRVQRVPVTESQGRVHTSSATMIVLPEAEEVEVDIHDNDLRVDTYRSSGSGGQSVNTMDSAVRITHVPTGLVVTMQDEKSQLKNKNKAMKVLRSRLLALEQEKAASEASDLRKGQVNTGDRSEKIRTYNFKENRVTDHRIGLTLHKLDRVLAGELDDVSDALVAEERQRQLEDDNPEDSR